MHLDCLLERDRGVPDGGREQCGAAARPASDRSFPDLGVGRVLRSANDVRGHNISTPLCGRVGFVRSERRAGVMMCPALADKVLVARCSRSPP
jgi:hypothetical protein